MAKLAYSKLKVKVNEDIKTFDYKVGDETLTIEVKQYLPFEDKIKILEKVIPVADKVVNISPVRWLQDPLAKYKKNSDYKKFEESISKKIESLDVISTYALSEVNATR